MTMLLVQIFLLLLAAFLMGATTACLYRRLSHLTEREEAPVAPAEPLQTATVTAAPAAVAANRFDRALLGEASAGGAPPHFQVAGPPVVEVQPPPAPDIPTPPQRLAVPTTPVAPEPPPARKTSRFGFAGTAPRSPDAEPTKIVIPTEQPAPAAAIEPIEPASEAVTLVVPPPEAPPPAETPPPAAEAPAPSEIVIPVEETQPKGDDLTRIRSIDPETQKRLADLGVTTYSTIAAWTAGDLGRISQSLGFLGRIEQENWVGQADILARGGDPGPLPPRVVPESTQGAEGADRLHRIIGIDADIEEILIRSGVSKFSQIANWIASDIEHVERLLGRPGRVGLQNWVGQAKVLARADVQAAPASSATPSEAAPAPSPAAEPTSDETPSMPRSDVTGLRSVRSAALRSDAFGPYSPPIGDVDDLKRIRGIGVLIEKKLNSLGITTYEQIANWTGADVDRISQVLDFRGRIERESWVEQSRILASGGQTDFSRRADRSDAETV